MKRLYPLLGVALIAASCNQSAEPAAEENTAEDAATVVEEAPVVETPEANPELTLLWESEATLPTNESILLDPSGSFLYVSNIDGKPTDKDGKGHIALVDMDGQVTNAEWAKDINAPKGMGIFGDKLYVTNIDELVEVNLADGRITKGFTIPDAEFLNDVAVSGDRVFFSDMNTGKLHTYNGIRIALFSEGHEGLNGLAYHNQNLYALDNSGLIRFPLTGGEPEVINSEVTGGDGLVVIDENTFVASRWKGEIWFIHHGTATKILDSKEEGIETADIAYDPSSKTLYVPRFFSNKISAYRLTY